MSQINKTRILFVLLFIAAFCFYFTHVYFKSEDPVEINELHNKTIEKYQKQGRDRREYLRDRINLSSFSGLYNILVPEVFCRDLIRIGSIADGGKWICNPINMLDWPECNIYSLGISNDPSFEEDLQGFLNNKCKVRSVDKDDQESTTMERIKKINGEFKKALIGGERNESGNIYRFNDILEEFGDKRIDILKIDIEGAEFKILNELLSTPTCQILIEVHGTPETTLKFLQTLSTNGFFLFSYEINGGFHELSEYSFIHKSCLSLFNIKYIFGKYLS